MRRSRSKPSAGVKSTKKGKTVQRPRRPSSARFSRRPSFETGAVTMDQVAELAGVSAKTVSRVINDEPTVHAETRESVLRAIEQLRYQPNLNARGLAGNRSFLIGLFCDQPGDYLSDFLAGAVERCRESSFHLMVEPWGETQPAIERQIDRLLGQLRLEGVILLPPLSDSAVMLDKLRRAAIPFVRIAPRLEERSSPAIGIDDYSAARQMTAHLIGMGHRRIGFIRGRPGHGATETRHSGFVDEMAAHGLPVHPELVETGNFLYQDGLECAERLLHLAAPPTAIFASNDDTAVAAVCAARKIGLDLPAQLSVAGFDDAPVATMIWPELTTIRQPVAAMGRAAIELIIEHAPRLRGWPDPAPRRVLDYTLLVRNSTAPPQSRD